MAKSVSHILSFSKRSSSTSECVWVCALRSCSSLAWKIFRPFADIRSATESIFYLFLFCFVSFRSVRVSVSVRMCIGSMCGWSRNMKTKKKMKAIVVLNSIVIGRSSLESFASVCARARSHFLRISNAKQTPPHTRDSNEFFPRFCALLSASWRRRRIFPWPTIKCVCLCFGRSTM